MSIALPSMTAVRPRVFTPDTGEPRLLEEVVAELADEIPSGLVRLIGDFGSGKSTAIAYLSAMFADDPRLVFLDEPTPDQLEFYAPVRLVVATIPKRHGYGKHDAKAATDSRGNDGT